MGLSVKFKIEGGIPSLFYLFLLLWASAVMELFYLLTGLFYQLVSPRLVNTKAKLQYGRLTGSKADSTSIFEDLLEGSILCPGNNNVNGKLGSFSPLLNQR